MASRPRSTGRLQRPTDAAIRAWFFVLNIIPICILAFVVNPAYGMLLFIYDLFIRPIVTDKGLLMASIQCNQELITLIFGAFVVGSAQKNLDDGFSLLYERCLRSPSNPPCIQELEGLDSSQARKLKRSSCGLLLATMHTDHADSDSEPETNEGTALVYPTSHRGPVLNAATGWPYSFKMGSLKQLSLFQVRHCCNTYDTKGYSQHHMPVQKDPTCLFYDSPKQYLTHRAHMCGLAGTNDDVHHLIRYGFGSQPPLDMASWAKLVSNWTQRKNAILAETSGDITRAF